MKDELFSLLVCLLLRFVRQGSIRILISKKELKRFLILYANHSKILLDFFSPPSLLIHDLLEQRFLNMAGHFLWLRSYRTFLLFLEFRFFNHFFNFSLPNRFRFLILLLSLIELIRLRLCQRELLPFRWRSSIIVVQHCFLVISHFIRLAVNFFLIVSVFLLTRTISKSTYPNMLLLLVVLIPIVVISIIFIIIFLLFTASIVSWSSFSN